MTPPTWLFWPKSLIAPPSAPWSPAALSTLRAWFKSDGITGVSDGGEINKWGDSSGNGNDVTNTQTSLRPTYETNELDGKPVVRFYNSSGFTYSSGNIYASSTTDVQIVAVAKWNSANNVAICDVAGYSPLMRVQNSQVAIFALNGGGNLTLGQGTISSGSWFVGAVSVDWPNKILGASLNGNTPTTAAWNNTATSVGPLANTAIQIGSRYSETFLPFDGDIAEVVIFTNDGTSETRQIVEGYLAHKWGLQGNLPSGHPYKNSPPLAPSVAATGGTITESGGYRYHTFTSSGSLSVSTGGTVEVLLVGGGGGGGRSSIGGGGGGAGGVRLLDGASSLTVSAATYSITVGGGGVGLSSTNGNGDNGGDSSIVGGSISETALGGGGGAGPTLDGSSGGSGGGGAGGTTKVSLGGAGTSGQGFDGGDGSSDSSNANNRNGGGGGGASAAGADATVTPNGAGNGGDGTTVWGTAYGGGGGGAARSTSNTGGAGGLGGGGSGGRFGQDGGDGTPNTGGGGGGSASAISGNGGSGIVIVRYAI
jgi:hypothetical protein